MMEILIKNIDAIALAMETLAKHIDIIIEGLEIAIEDDDKYEITDGIDGLKTKLDGLKLEINKLKESHKESLKYLGEMK